MQHNKVNNLAHIYSYMQLFKNLLAFNIYCAALRNVIFSSQSTKL